MIDLQNITKIYKRGKVEIIGVDNISLKVPVGEFLAIMGPSGSGKSTLMNIIGCLDRPTTGSYLLDNEDIMKYSDKELAKIRNRKIGFVFQMFNLLPRINCMRNVELPLLYAGWGRDGRRKRAISLLQEVGLRDRLYHKPMELSGGEMQRVAIARALSNNPKILCADEPTGNVDTKTSMKIMQIFKELNTQGTTIILVTHNYETASFAQRIIKLKDGKILEG